MPFIDMSEALSQPERLLHLVQLMLTMEPSIVERAALLLTRIIEDNPTLPRLYLTGAFFFAADVVLDGTFFFTGSG